MTTQTQIRIDDDVKKDAVLVLKTLGLDMSTAVNLFLHQLVLKGGLPFSVEIPNYNKETLNAIEEAKRISNDPSIKGYDNIKDLRKALEED